MRRLLVVEGELADTAKLNEHLLQQNDLLKQELSELQRAAERDAILNNDVVPLPPNVRHDGRSSPASAHSAGETGGAGHHGINVQVTFPARGIVHLIHACVAPVLEEPRG
jgi:hypothetical protein